MGFIGINEITSKLRLITKVFKYAFEFVRKLFEA